MSFIAPSRVDMKLVHSCYFDDDGKSKEPLVIDQSMTMKGNENDYGWPESDIQLMMKAQSQEEIGYYMRRMKDLRLNDPSNEGLTDDQIAAKVLPSNANTPVSYANAVAAAQRYLLERSAPAATPAAAPAASPTDTPADNPAATPAATPAASE